MRKFYFFLPFCLLAAATFGQRNEWQTGYQLSLPTAEMRNGWNTGHGLHGSYYRHITKAKGLSIGADVGFGNYATKMQPQQYRFPDGSITNTTARLNSSLGNIGLGVRYQPVALGIIYPFAELQAGYFWMNSSIYIEDPSDPLGCRALENRNLVNSGTAYWAPGAGFQIQLNKKQASRRTALEFRARYLRGGEMEYANMKRLYHNQDQTGNQTANRGNGEAPLRVTFVNVTTNEQHQHTVAELYNHPLRALQFNVTYSVRPGKTN